MRSKSLFLALGILASSSNHATADFPGSDTATRMLRTAAWTGNLKDVEDALKQGADPRQSDGYGITPLHLASKWAHPRVVEILLSAGANVDAKDDQGRTALHLASFGCSTPTARLLLGRRANVNARADNGSTPLHSAAQGACIRIVQALLSEPEIDLYARDDRMRSAFQYADENWALGQDMYSIDLMKEELSRRTLKRAHPTQPVRLKPMPLK